MRIFDVRNWRVSEKGAKAGRRLISESVFSIGNGYMGSRGTFEESRTGEGGILGTYAAGLFDDFMDGRDWVSQMVNLPHFWRVAVRIDGEPVTMDAKVRDVRRTLDLRTGTLERSLVYTTAEGSRLRMTYTRFISMARKHVAAQRVCIEALDGPVKVQIAAGLDAKVGNIDWAGLTYAIGQVGLFPLRVRQAGPWKADGGCVVTRTTETKIDIAEAFRTAMTDADGKPLRSRPSCSAGDDLVDANYRLTVRPGSPVRLDKVVALATSRDPGEVGTPLQRVRKECDAAFAAGFDALAAETADAWSDRWADADVQIDGNAHDQAAVRFAIHLLLMSNASDDPDSNIGSRGLTAETHRGACFWDTELFMFPFYLYTDPSSARKLMEYRCRRLDGARAKAAEHMYRGAMFPWMSAYDGREQAMNWEYGHLSVHITADVAHALRQYVSTTGDHALIVEGGAELLAETARFWMSRIVWDADHKQYVIPAVKGPNEYDGVVYNNLFTNWMTAWNLRGAVDALKDLARREPAAHRRLRKRLKITSAEIASWTRAARLLKLPYDAKRDLWLEDDNFLTKVPMDVAAVRKRLGKTMFTEGIPYDVIVSHRVVKQADVLLLMYLFPEAFPERQVRRAYDVYEPLTAHDSSLSHNTYSIMGVRVGDMAKAYEHFQETAYLDLEDRAGNSDGGLHSACCGGTWQAVVFGFAGVRIAGPKVSISPELPPTWKRVSFRLKHRGRTLQVEADRKGGRITDLATGRLVAES